MKLRHLWRRLVLFASAAAAIGVMIPAALAYIVTETQPIVNTFHAVYTPARGTTVDVCVQKTVSGAHDVLITPAGFRFELENLDTGDVQILTTDAEGNARHTLSFEDADLDATFRYRLSEIDDGRENIRYSRQIYDVVIRIELDEAAHQLVAVSTVNGAPADSIVAAFENAYAPPPVVPHTGDNTPLALYALLMMVSAAAAFELKRFIIRLN